MKIPQVSVFVSNRPGRLHAVCKSLADAGVASPLPTPA